MAGYSPPPREHRSLQHEQGGGKFRSERQRRFMWAVAPRAARRWAENQRTSKPDWTGAHGISARVHTAVKSAPSTGSFRAPTGAFRVRGGNAGGRSTQRRPKVGGRSTLGRTVGYKSPRRSVRRGGSGNFTRRGPRR